MAFTDTPKIGVDLQSIQQDVSRPVTGDYERSHRPLSRIWGNDSCQYVYAIAGAAIAADLATVSIDDETGVATATGGAFTAPAFALATGDGAWFKLPIDVGA